MSKNKIELVTTSRAHLVQICATLARGMEQAFLADRNAPVLVSVRGTYESGKKIVPDVMREQLDTCTLLSRDKQVETWSNPINSREAWFMDAAYTLKMHPSREEFARWEEQKNGLLSKRAAGGITFIHNDERFEKEGAGLKIWIEGSNASNKMSVVGLDDRRGTHSTLAQKFNKTQKDQRNNSWVRYIEISVDDPRLQASEKFQKALHSLPALIAPPKPAAYRR